jgi:hypothetical protein
MKILLSFFTIVLSIAVTEGQITLHQSDFGTIGYTAIQNNDTLPANTIHVGNPSSLQQSWDFTTLHNHYQDTIYFISIDSTNYPLDFSTSDIAYWATDDGAYNFINSSPTGIIANGQGLDSGYLSNTTPNQAVVLHPSETYLNFPTTYNSTFSGTTHFVVTIDTTFSWFPFTVDTARDTSTTVYSSTFDAWGTVTTPLGTFNCIRQRYVEYHYDTVWIHFDTVNIWGQTNPSVDSTLTYRWFTNNKGFALVEIDMDSAWANPNYVTWLASSNFTTSITEIPNNLSKFSIYPNPANDELNILNPSMEGAFMIIYDLMGREMDKVYLNERLTKINTSNYSNGLYSYHVFNTKTESLLTGKFIINK